MCRKLGCTNVADLDSMKQFNAEIKNRIDAADGMAVFMGKKALPKLTVDLFIVDWDSPPGGVVRFMRDLKSKYSGKYQFIVVADKKHSSSLGAALKGGAYDGLIKPFMLSEFREKIEEALSGRERMVVKSFNLGGAVTGSQKKGYSGNPFAVSKEKEPGPAAGSKEEAQPVKLPEPEPKPVTVKPAKAPPAAAPGTGRASFYGRSGGQARSDTVTATLKDGKIDGHYHQKVDVIGGGENCYWAREIKDGQVRLEYLNAKGEATGMEAKKVGRDDFMHMFYLCEEHGCQILKNLGKWPPPK
ncbi:MAG: hypothetical protein ACE5EN_10245 [Nitrospinota bacterium]